MARQNPIGTVTVVGELDPWKLHQALADTVGAQYGCKITVTSVRYKDTGEEVPRRTGSGVGA